MVLIKIIYTGNDNYPACVTRGAHIGGNKPFKKSFLKFFTENLL